MQFHQHSHDHSITDPQLLENRTATRALVISFCVLILTAMLQTGVAYFTGSTGLLADTIHNYADAFSSIPLWLAFVLSRRRPTSRFNYGLDRLEDLAGLVLILIIFASAVLVIYESFRRLINPQQISHHFWGIAAAVIGFIGNELVAVYKINTGRKIESAALVADGYHARTDGLTSLAAAAGILFAWLRFPIADALIGLLISVFVLILTYRSGKELIIRLVDGVSPKLRDEVEHLCRHHKEVQDIYDIRARWSGRKILAEITLALNPTLNLEAAHQIAEEVRHTLLHEINRLQDVTVHFDPAGVHHAHELTAHHFNKQP